MMWLHLIDQKYFKGQTLNKLLSISSMSKALGVSTAEHVKKHDVYLNPQGWSGQTAGLYDWNSYNNITEMNY